VFVGCVLAAGLLYQALKVSKRRREIAASSGSLGRAAQVAQEVQLRALGASATADERSRR
jgi:hypothetical protein